MGLPNLKLKSNRERKKTALINEIIIMIINRVPGNQNYTDTEPHEYCRLALQSPKPAKVQRGRGESINDRKRSTVEG